MNKVIIMGRLTRDPEVRWTQQNGSQEQMCIARYTLAVDRRTKDGGADFPQVVAFGKAGEFAERYFKKGTKLVVTGRIQTGSYTNRDGAKVYTTEIVAEDQEFAESKAAAGSRQHRRRRAAGKRKNASAGRRRRLYEHSRRYRRRIAIQLRNTDGRSKRRQRRRARMSHRRLLFKH